MYGFLPHPQSLGKEIDNGSNRFHSHGYQLHNIQAHPIELHRAYDVAQMYHHDCIVIVHNYTP